jgi:hypothetical protein
LEAHGLRMTEKSEGVREIENRRDKRKKRIRERKG